jgi:hypothetical protein
LNILESWWGSLEFAQLPELLSGEGVVREIDVFKVFQVWDFSRVNGIDDINSDLRSLRFLVFIKSVEEFWLTSNNLVFLILSIFLSFIEEFKTNLGILDKTLVVFIVSLSIKELSLFFLFSFLNGSLVLNGNGLFSNFVECILCVIDDVLLKSNLTRNLSNLFINQTKDFFIIILI